MTAISACFPRLTRRYPALPALPLRYSIRPGLTRWRIALALLSFPTITKLIEAFNRVNPVVFTKVSSCRSD